MRTFRVASLGLLIGFVLAGCVVSEAPRSAAEISAAQHAQDLAAQGQLVEAAHAYLTLASTASARADHYRLLAAEAYRNNGTLGDAAPVLALIKRENLQDDEPSRLDLLRAELALRQQDPQTALRLTTQVGQVVPAALQLRLLDLRSQAMDATGDFWGAAHARVEMDGQLSPLDQTQNHQKIVDLLARLGAPALQQRAAALGNDSRMLPWINEALTKLGIAVAHPQPTLNQPVGTELPGANANVREGYKAPKQIALLLPASGNPAAAGNAVREGFFAAYADADKNHAPRPLVRVYDSGGNADSAVKAYQQAVSDGAQLVVGPLTRGEVAAVFAQPQLPVPLLALNHPDNKNLPANGTAEFGLLPETEGAEAADHMAENGIRGVYVIVSADDFAQRAASAFKAELTARGGQTLGMSTLPTAGGYNYNALIKGLDMPSAAAPGADNTAPAAAASTGDAPASSDQGIFISMRPQQARLLMPQLQIARITLPVFGTSHVYAGTDDAADDKDLDGLEFSDAPWLFDAQPGLPSHSDIAAQLPSARGVSARLFAFGMDAWNLVPYLEWMRANPGSYLPGASGQLTADPLGRIRRVLIWAKFDNGLARPVAGNLHIDDVPVATPPADQSTAPASSSSSDSTLP